MKHNEAIVLQTILNNNLITYVGKIFYSHAGYDITIKNGYYVIINFNPAFIYKKHTSSDIDVQKFLQDFNEYLKDVTGPNLLKEVYIYMVSPTTGIIYNFWGH